VIAGQKLAEKRRNGSHKRGTGLGSPNSWFVVVRDGSKVLCRDFAVHSIVRPIKQDDRSGDSEMEAVQVKQVMTKDGEVLLTGLPFKKGQSVEIIVLSQPTTLLPRARLTVGRLRQSGLIGLWQDRDDISDSSAYARQLREQAQQRGDIQR